MKIGPAIILSGMLTTGGFAAGGTPAVLPTQSSTPSFKVFSVYTDKGGRHTHFAPSGYMGDSDLSLSGAFIPTPEGKGPCLRATYKATGAKGWAGLYWQDPANNWGDVPGHAGYDLRGATKLTFWAKGDKGGERIHEFRVGGIVGQYPDSDVASLSNVRLTRDWKQYTIDLSKKDLRHIIAGFGIFFSKAENPSGSTIYIDDIFFEGAHSQDAALSSMGSELTGRLPAETTVQATTPAAVPVATPVVPLPAALAPPVPETKDLDVKTIDSGLKVSFSSRLMFKPGQSVLEVSSGKVLDQLISLLTAYPTNRVLIEGHTDKTGDSAFNLKLSELRARSVRDYLIAHGGYETSRFQIVGYGDTKPIADNNTKAGRSMNRRVEVTILKTVTP